MKFVSFLNMLNEERLGFVSDQKVYDLRDAVKAMKMTIPSTMHDFLKDSESNLILARRIEKAVQEKEVSVESSVVKKMLAPISHPNSCRDAYAFRNHVEAMRRNRGVEMIPEFDQFPVFYFTNHNTIVGEGDVPVHEDHLHQLDFELEAAIVIGKTGKNVEAKDADKYIFGYAIMNDFSARLLQMEEMKLNLGPAKGKDFATAIGPWLVTPDELENYRIQSEKGNRYDLQMIARHNGKLISDGNMKSMDWTFEEILERVSYGTEIYPGDVVGSGTVGTGCYAELNGTAVLKAKEHGDSFTPSWLEDGDVIELEITGLGCLRNTIVKMEAPYSILAKKKNI
ncbi:MAG: Ureidoglycolate lyase [Candidatus Scalindua rubra]|uniref:Ureidoglycolate lyase n=1 Tax=Candidatus Scalindua rubra TaxID=1872076 RepID=A0A1E3X4P6_9BACT|nr:MAG: Ureidoglycolate lyase [Candidatus Scalindua rubra]